MKCYLCGTDLNYQEVIANKEDMRWNCYGKDKKIVKCGFCSLIQLIPQWAEEELKEIYANYSTKKDFSEQKIEDKKYFPYLDKYFKKNDFILEVGCGLGGNLFRLKEKGYKIKGFDRDPTVCDGKNVINSSVSILKNGAFKEVYDVIYGIHILEHLDNPLEFIENCFNALAKGGRLILEIPNMEEPLLTLWNNKNYAKYCWIPDHSFFYSWGTAIKLITSTSFFYKFRIIRIQRYGLFNHLNWFFRGKPTNIKLNIPILDFLYKKFLINIKEKSDTLLIILEKE